MALLAPETVTTPTPEQGESYYSLNQWAPGAAPTVNDDETAGFTAGSFWFYSGSLYVCTDPTATAAVWNEIRADEIAVDTTAVTGGTVGYLLYHKSGNVIGEVAADLADPNADRIAFWDDSAGKLTWLTLGTNLSITGTTLDAAAGGGMTIGNAVTGGGANRVLYEDGSQNLAANSKFLFDGSTLSIQAQSSAQTADIFQVIRYDGVNGFRVDDDTTVTIGGTYDYSNAKHASKHVFNFTTGLQLNNIGTGLNIELRTTTGPSLYITDTSGSAAPLVLSVRGNPSDNSTFVAGYNLWYLPDSTSSFSVATSSSGGQFNVASTSKPQARLYYDTSNYFSTTVGSTGGVTFDAVGSGAGFTFSDDVSVPDEAYDATAWNGSLEVPTKNAIRDKIEALSLGAGMTIGNAVTGGGANRVLYEDASQNLAASSLFVYDGAGHVGINGAADPSYQLALSGSFAGAIIYGSSAADLIFGHSGSAINAKYSTLRHQAGVGSVSTFTDAFGYQVQGLLSWDALTGKVGIGLGGTAPSTARLEIRDTASQLRLSYDGSNYFSTTVSSTGGVTFDAVGSGAGFTFSDDVTLADAKNLIFNTTTGTKIGTATTQKLGFFNATPIARPASAGAITDSIGGGSAGGTITSVTGADTVDLNKLEEFLSTLALTINDIRSKLVDLGLIS